MLTNIKMFSKQSTERLNAKKIALAQNHMQNNLSAHLSLKKMAAHVGLSPSYFQRVFKQQLNETPRNYVTRLRLEKSYYELRLTTKSLLEVAQSLGFNNPETYSRNFKSHFGFSPSTVVRAGLNQKKHLKLKHTNIKRGLISHQNTTMQVTYIPTLKLAYHRHTGAYSTVPLVNSKDSPWHSLAANSEVTSSQQKAVFIGIPRDNPNVTAACKLRYDLCVLVEGLSTESADLRYQTLAAGYYAVLTHAGSYCSLPNSYTRLFSEASQISGFQMATRPWFELLIDINAKTPSDHTWTGLYLPLNKC